MTEHVYTTQQTAKRYKAIQLFGLCSLVLAIALAVTADGAGQFVLAILLWVLGGATCLVGGFLAWWHHA